MLTPCATYDASYSGFRWKVPATYNIATDVVDRHAAARPDAVALIFEDDTGAVRTYSFRDIQRLANRFANTLRAFGMGPGDRLAVLLGQRPETAFAHIGAYKMGAVAIPMFTLFGADALRFRLVDSQARALVTDAENYPKVATLRQDLPGLEHVFLIDGAEAGAIDLWAEMEKASDAFETLATAADAPALLSYTSGTTGPPKGRCMRTG